MHTFSNSTFLRAVGQPADLLPPGPPEIAFAGRSNVGKSSAINALLGRRRLARISKTPGRTQTINFYEIGEGQRLVDLPGYGYARVSKLLREQWGTLVGAYLRDRDGLAAVVLVMDARHPLTPLDLQLLGWLQRSRVLALLSKADKLSRKEQDATLNKVRLQLAGEVRLFSSTTRQGVDECRELLAKWLQNESGPPQSVAAAARRNKRPPVKGI
jgi:GTP-binding protein